MCLAHYSPDYCFSPAITEKIQQTHLSMISCQSHDKLTSDLIFHTHKACVPLLPLVFIFFPSMSTFENFHPNKSKHSPPTDKELPLLRQEAKASKAKQGSKIPIQVATDLPTSDIIMSHRPNKTESRNHAKLSSWPLANLLPKLEPDAVAVIASCLRQKSCCSGARCCLNNKCLPK